MISTITSLLAENRINIVDMLNKSKGDLAYNIIITEKKVSEEIKEKLESVDGIILVRVIK
jgi:D-3-phosphoglycerate dehydrogenase